MDNEPTDHGFPHQAEKATDSSAPHPFPHHGEGVFSKQSIAFSAMPLPVQQVSPAPVQRRPLNTTTTVTLRLPTDYTEALWDAADSLGLSLPALIREAMAAHLGSHPGIDPALAAQLVKLAAQIQNRPSRRMKAEPGNGNGKGEG